MGHVAARKAKQNKHLVLLRHAKSSWDDPLLADFDRPLAKRGRKSAKRIAAWMAQQRIRPALVLCSASARTRETLDLIRDALGPNVKVLYERRLYLADMGDLLARIREVSDDVECLMLIGHNPGMHDLATALTPKAGRVKTGIADKFPTAALAWFISTATGWSEFGPGRTELVAFVKPSDLGD